MSSMHFAHHFAIYSVYDKNYASLCTWYCYEFEYCGQGGCCCSFHAWPRSWLTCFMTSLAWLRTATSFGRLFLHATRLQHIAYAVARIIGRPYVRRVDHTTRKLCHSKDDIRRYW